MRIANLFSLKITPEKFGILDENVILVQYTTGGSPWLPGCLAVWYRHYQEKSSDQRALSRCTGVLLFGRACMLLIISNLYRGGLQ